MIVNKMKSGRPSLAHLYIPKIDYASKQGIFGSCVLPNLVRFTTSLLCNKFTRPVSDDMASPPPGVR
jgi:hypothetical protein